MGSREKVQRRGWAGPGAEVRGIGVLPRGGGADMHTDAEPSKTNKGYLALFMTLKMPKWKRTWR